MVNSLFLGICNPAGPDRPVPLLRPHPADDQPLRVRHHAARVGGWSVTESGSFRIYHRQRPESGAKVARAAEAARATALRRWFAAAEPAWSPLCEIFLHPTGADYSQATGVSSAVPGHTSIQRSGTRVLSRRIDLHGDSDNLYEAVLPHEVTHAVLADKFGGRAPPLWASEAMAIMAEPRDVIASHRRSLHVFRRDGHLYPVGQLVQLSGYPEPRQLRPYYAQSVSLVELLAAAKGHQVFVEFLRDAQQRGSPAALKHHYGWDFAELDRQWRQHAFGAPPAQISAIKTPR